MREFFSLGSVAVMIFTVSVFSFADSHDTAVQQEAGVTRQVVAPSGVKGETSSEGDLFAEEFTSFYKDEKAPVLKEQRLTKKTMSGSEFKRISEAELRTAGIKDPKKFGEAWQDPSGMIWGDIAKREDGSAFTMNHKDAEAYCKSLGAELPSGYLEIQNGKDGFPNTDSDFVRLRKYMGGKSVAGYQRSKGYVPQILPNLTYVENNKTYIRWHWSSSIVPKDRNDAWVFVGHNGSVNSVYRGAYYYYTVRCVARAASV